MTVEQFVAYAGNAYPLSGIAESLRPADKQDVVVGIVCHGRLVRRLERTAHVLTEVHCEVCQVFHYDGIILRCQLADGAQLVVGEAHPRGVVGVRVDYGADVSLLEIALELWPQLVAAIVIHVKRLVGNALHL